MAASADVDVYPSRREKDELDRQMQSVCARDGGLKIYETVPLPRETLEEYHQLFPRWRARAKENKLGREYSYSVEEQVLKRGDPSRVRDG